MNPDDLYTSAHLFVAGIRVSEYRDTARPSMETVCKLLALSLEQGNFICKKLMEYGIIDVVEGAFGTRLFIKDHLKIEEIPGKEKESRIEDEVKKFQVSRKEFAQKIESIQAAQAEKKKSLFADVEKRFKEQMDKRTPPTK
jgi:hypothetical protein